jgi:23S rRNA (cytidine1920-2'-O)/16S rRNA (cytidine1409-2'-O)-methyltransferase
VVRDPSVWRRTIDRVAAACAEAGLAPVGVMPSPVRGPAGNVEFPLHARAASAAATLDLDRAIEQAGRIGGPS